MPTRNWDGFKLFFFLSVARPMLLPYPNRQTCGESILRQKTKGLVKDEACVRMLLKSAANVNIQDSDGNTPLHWGAMVDAGKCIRCLLEWRAEFQPFPTSCSPQYIEEVQRQQAAYC